MAHNNTHGSYKVPTQNSKTTAKVGIRHAIKGHHKVGMSNGESVARTQNVPVKASRVHGTKMMKTKPGIAM